MTKRYIGFLLALCTLLALCAPALAAEADGPALEAPEAPAFIGEEEPAEEESLAPVEPELTEPAADMPAEAVFEQPEPMEEADAPLAAASGSCGTNVNYDLSGGVLTISGTGAMSNYSLYSGRLAPWYASRDQVRSVVVSQGVTGVGDEAFMACGNMTSVSLPNSLTSIGLSAFRDCTSLRTVTIPNSVRTMGYAAFSMCTSLTSATLSSGMANIPQHTFSECTSLTSVTIPSSVTSINTNAFYNCSSLRSVTIPSRVTTIYPSAFQACTSLTSVTIPASVTQIGALAFADCTRLSSVTFAGSSTKLESRVFENTPWMKNQGTFVVQNGVLLYYQGSGGSVTIPGNVTSIDDYVFNGRKDVTSVTIPGSVKTIGDWAFSDSGLRSVTISYGVQTIGDDAFVECLDLASVSIAGSVTTIGDEAFSLCPSLTSVTIPEGVQTIGERAFQDCAALHTVTIPSTVRSIGANAFTNYKLRKIIINGATFTYGHDDLPPAATVYSNGTGSARAYASAMGVHFSALSQQHLNGWHKVDENTWYCYDDGKKVANEWRADGNTWNYLGPDGKMLVGLQNIVNMREDDGLYYLDPSHSGSFGTMLVGWQVVGGRYYYFNTKHDGRYGVGLTGWLTDAGNTYYLDPETGAMLVGWQNINGQRYYFNTSHDGSYGARFTGWHQIDGTWYQFNSDGTLAQSGGTPPAGPQAPAGGSGWVYYEGNDYYFLNGVMKTNYWAADAGASKWNFWYYCGADGKMLKGFQYIDNPNGTGWYMLQADNTNGARGRLLEGSQDTHTAAGTGWFTTTRGVDYGKCTRTSNWGSYNPATGLWSADGQSHR